MHVLTSAWRTKHLDVARGVLSIRHMSRWLLALVLAVAPATGWAQSAPAVTTQVTVSSQDALRKAELLVGTRTAARNALSKQQDDQLKTVDRLKQQRASWRRDRDLKDALAQAQGTATKLAAAAGELVRANAQLAAARKTLLGAIDAELSALPPGPASAQRIAALARWKAQLAPAAPRKNLQKIVIPDLEIDPLADPEELDAQAQELLRAEQELARQAIGLDKQARDLDQADKLRKQHERAKVLALRDDDQPSRVSRTEGARASDDSAAPEAAGGGTSSGGGDGGFGQGGESPLPGADPGLLSDASVVLSNVVDATTIETLTRASRSGDPAQRAQAAKSAHDAVARRIEQLRKKRLEIQAAAKSRRR